MVCIVGPAEDTTGGEAPGEWDGLVARDPSCHWRTGIVSVLIVGDVNAEKSNVVEPNKGESTGGWRCVYGGNAGKVKW